MAKIEDMCLNQKYNYKEKHSALKASIDALDKKHEDLLLVLTSFKGLTHKPINKQDLMKFPLLEWVELNDKVSIRRRKMLFGDYVNFDTILKKGGEFGKHFHADVIESAEVIEGKMLDKESGEVYNDHDVMHYEKGSHHTPIALLDTTLKVIFKP